MAFPLPKLVLLTLALASATLTSCRSTNQLLKSGPAKLSPFLQHPTEMITDRDHLPFHRIWWPRNPKGLAQASKHTQLYIAPVRLEYLRPVAKALPRKEIAIGSIQRREHDVAAYLRSEFGRAFMQSPAPRYRVVEKAGKDSVTLELALVELNPTSPKGNLVKTGLKFVIGPLAGLGGYFTKGNIAIEGRLRDSRTGLLLFEFADNEADKMTFYSMRDFRPYGHATVAIQEWAQQFETLIRSRPTDRIGDSRFFTLDPR